MLSAETYAYITIVLMALFLILVYFMNLSYKEKAKKYLEELKNKKFETDF